MFTILNLYFFESVIIDALGTTVFDGRISRIHAYLDPLTRRGTVEVKLTPVPAGARTGQYCRVTFKTRTAERPRMVKVSNTRTEERLRSVYVFNTLTQQL